MLIRKEHNVGLIPYRVQVGGGGVVGGGKEAVGPSRRWSIQLEGERRTEPYYNKDIAAGVFLPDWIF